MGTGRIGLKNVRLSLADLTGADYARALSETRAFLTGRSLSAYQALAEERVDFFPEAFRERLDRMLDSVGKPVVSGLPVSAAGAATQSVRRATNTGMAPLGGLGFYRVGEDGRLYLITKSEHYHAPLGHDFPGYRLVRIAEELGVPNATHNNTRGHITRVLERELVRVANGLDSANGALDRILASSEPHVLNRITNLETGSLAVEAALKAMLARFYRLEDHLPLPPYAGRTPVFLVIADQEGGRKANYHGTTMMTQVMRDMWPELGKSMADHGAYVIRGVKINDADDFRDVLERWDAPPYKAAGFFHEIVLMNYGAIRLEPDFLRAAYAMCRARDVPVMVDEIQSCIWSADIFMFREYGLQPDFVSIGKGFPGGQYAASRILGTAPYDTMQQFGALVTNGQEELASLAYLITLAFAESNREYVSALGDYYAQSLGNLASEFSDVIETVEGWRHLGALRFYSVDLAAQFSKAMNAAGYDVSAQTYKASCPPTILTKIPLIASYAMVDRFVGQMAQSLASLRS